MSLNLNEIKSNLDSAKTVRDLMLSMNKSIKEFENKDIGDDAIIGFAELEINERFNKILLAPGVNLQDTATQTGLNNLARRTSIIYKRISAIHKQNRERINNLEKQNSETENLLKDKTSQLEKLSKEISEKKSEIEDLSKLKPINETITKTLNEKDKELSKLNADLLSAKKEVKSYSQRQLEFSDQIQKNNSKISALENELSEKKAALTEITTKAMPFKSAALTGAKIAEQETEIKTLKNEIAGLKAQVLDLREQNQVLIKNNNSKQDEVVQNDQGNSQTVIQSNDQQQSVPPKTKKREYNRPGKVSIGVRLAPLSKHETPNPYALLKEGEAEQNISSTKSKKSLPLEKVIVPDVSSDSATMTLTEDQTVKSLPLEEVIVPDAPSNSASMNQAPVQQELEVPDSTDSKPTEELNSSAEKMTQESTVDSNEDSDSDPEATVLRNFFSYFNPFSYSNPFSRKAKSEDSASQLNAVAEQPVSNSENERASEYSDTESDSEQETPERGFSLHRLFLRQYQEAAPETIVEESEQNNNLEPIQPLTQRNISLMSMENSAVVAAGVGTLATLYGIDIPVSTKVASVVIGAGPLLASYAPSFNCPDISDSDTSESESESEDSLTTTQQTSNHLQTEEDNSSISSNSSESESDVSEKEDEQKLENPVDTLPDTSPALNQNRIENSQDPEMNSGYDADGEEGNIPNTQASSSSSAGKYIAITTGGVAVAGLSKVAIDNQNLILATIENYGSVIKALSQDMLTKEFWEPQAISATALFGVHSVISKLDRKINPNTPDSPTRAWTRMAISTIPTMGLIELINVYSSDLKNHVSTAVQNFNQADIKQTLSNGYQNLTTMLSNIESETPIYQNGLVTIKAKHVAAAVLGLGSLYTINKLFRQFKSRDAEKEKEVNI